MEVSNIRGVDYELDTPIFTQLAADDLMWLYASNDRQKMIDLFADPYAWVAKYIQNDQYTGKLASNFVITLGSEEPGLYNAVYVVEGINETAVITVRMVMSDESAATASARVTALAPNTDDVLQIVEYVDRCYAHWQIGQDPEMYLSVLEEATVNPSGFATRLTNMQQMNATTKEMLVDNAKNFYVRNTVVGLGDTSTAPPQLQILYQGDEDGAADENACNVNLGANNPYPNPSPDPDPANDVVLDTVIVKAYKTTTD